MPAYTGYSPNHQSMEHLLGPRLHELDQIPGMGGQQLPGMGPGLPQRPGGNPAGNNGGLQQMLESLMGGPSAAGGFPPDLFRQNQAMHRSNQLNHLQRFNPGMALMQRLDPSSWLGRP